MEPQHDEEISDHDASTPSLIDCITGAVDGFLVLLTFVICGILNSGLVQPYQRVVLCNDDTIRYPAKPSTVPFWSVVVGGGLLLAVQILLIEFANSLRKNTQNDDSPSSIVHWRGSFCLTYGYIMWKIGIFLLFGAAINELFTQSTKLLVGRQRPNFMNVCQPDKSVCKNLTYFSPGKCNGDLKDIRHSQSSFPSGHTSTAIYLATFGILHLHYRLIRTRIRVLTGILQCVWALVSIDVGLSRISDYKHHWSDVFGGAILGSTIAVISFFVLGQLHTLETSVPTLLVKLQNFDPNDMDLHLQSTLSSKNSGVRAIEDTPAVAQNTSHYQGPNYKFNRRSQNSGSTATALSHNAESQRHMTPV